MKRWLCVTGVALAILIAIAVAATRPVSADRNGDSTGSDKEGRGSRKSVGSRPQEPLTVRVVPFGPSPEKVREVSSAVMKNRAVRAAAGERHRLLSFELLDTDVKTATLAAAPPSRFRATIYSYTGNVAIIVEGSFEHPDELQIMRTNDQPIASPEEFAEAVALLRADSQFSERFARNELKAYEPMPPVLEANAKRPRVERTIMVGLLPTDGSSTTHEIVGVNLIHNIVTRYDGKAPVTSSALADSCGLPGAGQGASSRGAVNDGITNTAGQYQMTITQGDTELWNMIVVRPVNSSGTRASGIELRNVRYQGKSVLRRAHVPILNVQYTGNACGPYRDWQYAEEDFRADGTDLAPGFRQTATPPATILDSGDDFGNFRGVAMYNDGQSVTLVSELNASWYRYISEWRFNVDGTIRPRFGFGAVNSSCVCNAHNHHVFWRFDFDIVTPENNTVIEQPQVKRRFAFQTGSRAYFIQGTRLTTEVMRPRTTPDNRRWFIQNTNSLEAYMIRPGAGDGVSDPYSQGDLWVLRYRPVAQGVSALAAEFDDGVNATGGSVTATNISRFLNGESTENQDIVVWYGAHFLHNSSTSNDQDFHAPGDNSRVGPDLVPIGW